jgi:glycine C-acetyltransferase
MSLPELRAELRAELDGIEAAGTFKHERLLGSPQGARVRLADGVELINMCSNNYLGLADHPAIVEAARDALERWGFGLASVRFIVGTQQIHIELEERIAAFLGAEAAILYSSCFDANGGLFETLLDDRDVVISDALNHASIIDGIRLCKARRLRYANADMDELEARLRDAAGARRRLIATDGVFSMDGHLAPLDQICELAERHDALVMVDDSHGVGVVGPGGRGTPERFGVVERIDILTGTLGKALGGASGGYVAGRREIIEMLRQRSRPYLFSNSLAPPIVAAALAALERITASHEPRESLERAAAGWRERLTTLGFNLITGEHPIIPVMFGDATRAAAFAERLLDHGVYAIPFSYPVVPENQARIRTQVSAAHTDDHLELAARAFATTREELSED